MSNQENEQVDQKQQDGEHAYGRLVGQQIIYLLEELTTLVGRDEECDIVFDSKSISKKHASIHFLDEEGLRCELIDHMSRNGCFVNEDRVWNSKRNLEHGDTIRFGYDIVSFRFEYTNPMAVARGASVLQDSPFSSPFTSPERGGSSPSTSPERKKMDPADMPVAGVSSSELNENQAKNSIFGRRAFTMVTQPPPPASSYSSSQQQRVSASSASSPFSQSRQPHHPQHMNPMEYSQMKYSSQKTQSLPEEEQNEQQNRESLSTTSRRYDHSRSPSSASSEMQRSNTLRQRSDSDRPLLNKSPLQQDPRRSPLPSNVERPQTARDNWRDRPVVLEPRLMSSLGRREAEDLYGLPYRSEGERKMDERLMASAPVRRRPEFSERSWRRESKKYDDDDEDSDDDYDSSDESYGRRSKHLHRTSRSLHTSSRRKKSKPKKKKQGKESESSSESSQSESDSSESSEKNKKSPQKDISKSSSKSSKGGLEEDAAKLNETETQSPSSANPVSAQIPQSSYPSLPNQLSAPYPPAIPSPAVFSSPQAPNYAVERHMEELRMRGRESDISIARLEAERRVKTEMEMASLREKIAKEEGKKEAEQEIAQKIGGQSALSASLRRNSHRPLINEITEDSDEDDDTARGRQNISSRQSVLSTPSSRRQLDSDRSQNRMRSVLNRAKSDQMSLSKALTSPTLVSPLSDPALSSMSTARKIHHIASSCRSALDTLIAQCLERAECGLDESAVSETGQSADPEEERVFLSMSVAQLEKAREAVGLWDPMAPDGKALPIIPRRISASGKDEIDENASNFREQNQRLVEKEEQVRKLEQDVIVLQNEGEKMRKLLRMHQIDPSTGVADFDQSDSSNMAGDALSAQLKDAKDTVDELRRLITHKNEEIEYLKAATADLMANNSTMATSSSPSSSASKQGRVTDLLEAQRLNEELNERLSSQILHWTQLMRVNEELQFQVDQLTKMQHAREEDFIKMKSEMNQKTAEYEKKLCEIATSGRAYSRENDPSALKSSSSASDSNQQTYTEGGIQAAAQALVDKLAEEETAIVAIKGQDAIFRQQLMSLDEERTRLRVEVETLQQQPAQQEIDRLRSELTQLKAGVDPAKVIQMEQSLGKLHDECWRLKEEKAILLNQLKGEGGSDKTIEDSGNYHPPQELFEKGGQQTANFLGRNADTVLKPPISKIGDNTAFVNSQQMITGPFINMSSPRSLQPYFPSIISTATSHSTFPVPFNQNTLNSHHSYSSSPLQSDTLLSNSVGCPSYPSLVSRSPKSISQRQIDSRTLRSSQSIPTNGLTQFSNLTSSQSSSSNASAQDENELLHPNATKSSYKSNWSAIKPQLEDNNTFGKEQFGNIIPQLTQQSDFNISKSSHEQSNISNKYLEDIEMKKGAEKESEKSNRIVDTVHEDNIQSVDEENTQNKSLNINSSQIADLSDDEDTSKDNSANIQLNEDNLLHSKGIKDNPLMSNTQKNSESMLPPEKLEDSFIRDKGTIQNSMDERNSFLGELKDSSFEEENNETNKKSANSPTASIDLIKHYDKIQQGWGKWKEQWIKQNRRPEHRSSRSPSLRDKLSRSNSPLPPESLSSTMPPPSHNKSSSRLPLSSTLPFDAPSFDTSPARRAYDQQVATAHLRTRSKILHQHRPTSPSVEGTLTRSFPPSPPLSPERARL